MVANADAAYEQLAREVYQGILEAEGFGTIEVRHNVKIPGRSGQAHQIDIYWEFALAGVTHRVAVECKNYARAVSVGRVRDFSAALDDVGNTQGIFVTKSGYQRGAEIFAEAKGIQLMTLREPTPEDLASLGAPPSLVVRGHQYAIANVRPAVLFDVSWAQANTQLKEWDPVDISGRSDEIVFLSRAGGQICTYQDLVNSLPRRFEEASDVIHKTSFAEAYITWPGSPYPPLRVKEVAFRYDVAYSRTVSAFEGRWIAKAVLEDIKSGKIHFHGKHGQLAP